MRVALLLETLLAAAVWAGAARAQIEGNPVSPPLVDDTHAFGSRRPAEASVRFSIVMVKDEAILLDSSTGDTWRLVIADGDAKSPIRWAPIARKPQASKSRRPPKDKAEPPDAPPSDDGEVNPFAKRDEEPGKGPVPAIKSEKTKKAE